VAAAPGTRTSASRTYAGRSPAVGSATTSTEAASAAMGTASASAKSTPAMGAHAAETSAGMGTAKAAAAVRTVVAVAVDTAEPCLDTADMVVDYGAFRVTSGACGVVFSHHETL